MWPGVRYGPFTPRNRLSERQYMLHSAIEDLLCESFTLSLQQAVAGLSTLQLAVHLAQRLPRGEDGFSL